MKEFNSKYIIFYFTKRFNLTFEVCGYFDNRPRFNVSLFFFSLTLILPFKNSWTSECDCPRWGIGYHNQTLWIYTGGKGNMSGGSRWIIINMPWQLDWVRTSALRNDGSWIHESKNNRKNFFEDKWNNTLWIRKYPYKYKLKSGKVQKVVATIKVEEREWRMRAFRWLPLFNKVRRSIDINFDKEVGEKTGSWKGGVLGCGYDLLPNETPLQCLRRMENERKF